MSVESSLSAFFDGFVPVLRGSVDPGTIGGASEQEGLAFYQRMTSVELRRYLEQACPGLAIALELMQRGSFAEFARDYFLAHAPEGWDPGAVAAGLCQFLRGNENPRWGARCLAEIAEIHTLLRAAALAEDHAGEIFERTVFVRRYETTSPRFVRCVLDGRASALPSEAPTIGLVYRSHLTLRAHLIVPSADMLRALLAQARGEPCDPTSHAELVGLGVLPVSAERSG